MKFILPLLCLVVLVAAKPSRKDDGKAHIVPVVLTPVEAVAAGPKLNRKARQFFGGGGGFSGPSGYGGGYGGSGLGGGFGVPNGYGAYGGFGGSGLGGYGGYGGFGGSGYGGSGFGFGR